MSTAASIDWTQIQRFSQQEWPAGVLHHMQAGVILALADIRASLPEDHRMTPSPDPAAHIRSSGTSRHSLTNGRLSDATDIFMDTWAHAYAAWEKAMHHPDIGGVGFYLSKWIGSPDNIRPMLHFDCREEKMFWVCYRDDDGAQHYVYHHRDPALFHHLMSRHEC